MILVQPGARGPAGSPPQGRQPLRRMLARFPLGSERVYGTTGVNAGQVRICSGASEALEPTTSRKERKNQKAAKLGWLPGMDSNHKEVNPGNTYNLLNLRASESQESQGNTASCTRLVHGGQDRALGFVRGPNERESWECTLANQEGHAPRTLRAPQSSNARRTERSGSTPTERPLRPERFDIFGT